MPIQSLSPLTAAAISAADTGPIIPWARIVIAFLFCITLAIGAILWLRTRQGQPTSLSALWAQLKRPSTEIVPKAMAIEQRLRITPTGQFLVLRCDERRYLLHVGSQQAQLLDRLEDVDTPLEPGP